MQFVQVCGWEARSPMAARFARVRERVGRGALMKGGRCPHPVLDQRSGVPAGGGSHALVFGPGKWGPLADWVHTALARRYRPILLEPYR